MPSGLKDELGLGEPAPQASTQQSDQFRADYQAALAPVNACLQYTAAHAEQAKHDPHASKRDTTCSAYQVALGRIDPTNASVAQGAIDQVLTAVRGLGGAVDAFKQAVESALAAWNGREGDFDSVRDKIREMIEWGHDKASALQQIVDAIASKADLRKYEEALQALDQLQGKFDPLYEDFERQKAAKEEYEPAHAALEPRLGEASTCEFVSLEALQHEITAAADQMRQAADGKDYVAALEGARNVDTLLTSFQTEVAELQAKKAEYEQLAATVASRMPTGADAEFPTLAPMQEELAGLQGQMEQAAEAQEYHGAVSLANDLCARIDAYEQARAELEAKRQEYDQLASQVTSRMPTGSDAAFPKLATMQEELVGLQGQMEQAAGAGDYDAALSQANELSARIDEYEAARAELEAKKQEYEQARSQVDPKLAEASTSEFQSLAEMDQRIASLTSQTDAAASAGDYESALSSANELSTAVDEKLARAAELRNDKQAYEEARAGLEEQIDKALASGKDMVNAIAGVPQAEQAAKAEEYKEALQQVSAAAKRNFDDWDRDDDGYLSESEINTAMADGSLTGEDAVAAATLDRERENLEELSNDEYGDEDDGVTRSDLDQMSAGEGDNVGDVGHTASLMQDRNARAQLVPDEVVATGQTADPMAVQQGLAGSCGTLSTAAAVAARDPGDIQRMINDNEDGTYTVTFGNGDTVTVNRPTEAEMTAFANAGENGLWLSILEKAYGGGDQDDAVTHQDEAIARFTGSGTNTDENSLTSVDTLRSRLIEATGSNKLVVASNNQVFGVDEGIVDGYHAYTVLGYNAQTDRIRLRNPWGNTEPGGNGADDGVFEMSLADFQSNFNDITFEE